MAAVAPHEHVGRRSVRSLRPDDSSDSSALDTGRSVLSRHDTEHILDYYQSEDADHAFGAVGHSSQSESDFPPRSAQFTLQPRSTAKDVHVSLSRSSMESVNSAVSGGIQRRTSQRSARAGDNRRIAIVEMDSQYEPQAQPSQSEWNQVFSSSSRLGSDHNSLLSRRGKKGNSQFKGLTLMAPLDAHPSSYTDLSPVPSSAPPTGVPPEDDYVQSDPVTPGHQRSFSDYNSHRRTLQGSKASPRDVGIVGTLETMQSSKPQVASSSKPFKLGRPSTVDRDPENTKDGLLTAPVFQTPKSRSPSPVPRKEAPTTRGIIEDQHHYITKDSVAISRPEMGRSVVDPFTVDIDPDPPAVPNGLPVAESFMLESQSNESHDTHRTVGSLPFKPNQAGPAYLHYQPGIHSTAGPLPSPPRHILTEVNTSPPPRPPRLLSPPLSTRRTDSDQSLGSENAPHSDSLKTPSVKSQTPFRIPREESDFSIAAISVNSSGSDDRSAAVSSENPDEDQSVGRSSENGRIHEEPWSISSQSGSHVREGAFPSFSVFLPKPQNSSEPLLQTKQGTLTDIAVTTPRGVDKKEHSVLSSVPVVEGLRIVKRSRSHTEPQRVESPVAMIAESVEGVDEYSPPSSYRSSHESSPHVSAANIASDDGHFDQRRASLPISSPDAIKKIASSIPRTPSLSFEGHKSLAAPPPTHPLLLKGPLPWPEAMNFRQILVKRSAAERASGYAEKMRELARAESGLRDWLILNSRKERRGPQSSAVAPATVPRGFAKQSRHVSRNSMASEVTFPIRSDSYTATDLSLRTDMSSLSSSASLLPYPALAHGLGSRNQNSVNSDSPTRSMAPSSSSSRTLGSTFFASLGRKTSMRKDRALSPTTPTGPSAPRQNALAPQPRPVKIVATPSIPGGPRALPRRANSIKPAAAATHSEKTEDQDVSSSRSHAETNGTFSLQLQKLSDLLPQADKDVLAIYLRKAKNQDPMLAIGAYLNDEKQGALLRA